MPSPTEPRQIEDEAELERLFTAPRALLFKHSLICPVSARAFAEYRRFLDADGSEPNAWIDVIGQRPLSRAVEARTGVRHESPQAILLESGRVLWSASHGAITSAALEAALTRRA